MRYSPFQPRRPRRVMIGVAPIIAIPIVTGIIGIVTASYAAWRSQREEGDTAKAWDDDYWKPFHTPPPPEFGEPFAGAYDRYVQAITSILFASDLASVSKAAADALRQVSGSPTFTSPIARAAEGELGPERVAQARTRIQARIRSEVEDAFQRLVHDPVFRQAFDRNVIDQSRAQGRSLTEALIELHLTPNELAGRFDVRPDVAALATNALLGTPIHDVSERVFDPNSGAVRMTIAFDRRGGRNSDWALSDLLDVQNALPSASVEAISSSLSDYERAQRVDGPNPTDAGEILTELLIAQNRGASTSYVQELEAKYATALGRPPPDAIVRPPGTGTSDIGLSTIAVLSRQPPTRTSDVGLFAIAALARQPP